MKYLWSLMGLLLYAITGSAQTELPPGKEYRLLASATTIALSRGQQDSVKLTVLRSQSFKTGKASIALNAPNAAGLKAEIREVPNHTDAYMLYFTASNEAQPGEYSFVPTCTLRNKNKGIVLKLVIR